MKRLRPLIRQWDEDIRNARGDGVRKALAKLRLDRAPREHRADLARLAWRVDLPQLGIKLLHPFVRPRAKNPRAATDREKAEYAHCLIRIGALEEGERILEAVEGSATPEVWLYLASARMSRWDYDSAFPLLERYARSRAIPAYQRFVGKTNLAAALVALERYREADWLLRDLLHDLSVRRLNFLFGAALGIAVQSCALRGKWKDAEKCLSRASELLAGAGTLEPFFLRKWRAVADVIRSEGAPAALVELRAVRSEAVLRRHWETARQCDQFEAVARRDEALLTHVYFGTPYPHFRVQLLRDYPAPFTPPDRYPWRLGGGETEPVDLLGLLPRDGLLHRLLAALSSDFYRPFRVASLHYRLYPGEHYNPVTAPFRIYEAVKRARVWLREQGFPLEIAEEQGSYWLRAAAPFALWRVAAEGPKKGEDRIERLRRLWPETPFSVAEAARALGMHERTLTRLLAAAVEEGLVEKLGQTRGARYVFTRRRAA